jgi:hypothetical protein
MNPDARCVHIASSQHGVISRAQALGAGITDDGILRRLKRGQWNLYYAGIYIVGGAPSSWFQSLWAARLWADHDAYFTGRTGALLNRLDGIRDGAVEVTSPHKCRTPAPEVRVRFTSRPPSHLTIINALPVAPIERVLLDLMAVEYKARAELALDDAIRKEKTTVAGLHAFIATEGQGLWGVKRFRQLIAERPIDEIVLASELEKKFAPLLEDQSLPPVTRHHEVFLANGIPIELDFAYPHVKVAPEPDGYRWHTGRARWQHDLERQNALAEIGWLLLKFSWRDINRRPDYVITTLRRTIAEREALFRTSLRHP